MPIKDLSDRRRFSRGGKIRLGEKKVSPRTGQEYPSKLDYFLFDPYDKNLIPKWTELFGEFPRRIEVALPSEDPEIVFPQWYKCYGPGGKLYCKGDGEHAMRTSEEGDLVEVECPGPDDCDYAKERSKSGSSACTRVASLQVFVPDLPVMQVFQIDTGSKNSIINLNSQIDVLRRVCGRISFLPVDLVLKPYQTMANGKKVVVYVLDLVVGVGLKQIAALKPLIASTLPAPEAPPPSEVMPDDLYPRSMQQAKPVEVEYLETGEVLTDADAPPPDDDVPFDGPYEAEEQETAPDLPGLGDDPEVKALLAQLPPAKAQAMLASAVAGDWDKDKLVQIVQTHIKNAQPRSLQRKPAPPPEPEPPAEAEASEADLSNADGALF